MKLIGIGLNKTGTKTLGVCFKYWGFKHKSFDKVAFGLYRKGDFETLLRIVDEYDTFEDWPWPLIYRNIDSAYRDVKFILTTRKSADTWFRSLCEHAVRTGPNDYRKCVYGYEMPHEYRSHHIEVYNRHNQSVREYFRNRPGDFLEVCWEEGDGWDVLAEFLGLERPPLPFPHANKSPT